MNNIYLIDDDPICVFLTRKLVSSVFPGSIISEFCDGDIAIRHLTTIFDKPQLFPDIIFLDLNMPVLDGWGFLKEFTFLDPAIKQKTKIYILSSSISPREIARSRSIPQVTDYLVKPLEQEQLMSIFQRP